MTSPDLLGLEAEDFNAIVNLDIRGGDQENWQALRTADVVQRWYDSLCSMKRESERQLANYKNDRAIEHYRCLQHPNGKFEYTKWIANKAKWRTGVIRFKTGVEEKITEAKSYIRQFDDEDYYVE